MTEEELHGQLKDMFQDIRPDQETLDDDEDLQEQVDDIERIIHDDAVPVITQIEALVAFNTEWFPDGLNTDEQAEYRNLLNAAEAIL